MLTRSTDIASSGLTLLVATNRTFSFSGSRVFLPCKSSTICVISKDLVTPFPCSRVAFSTPKAKLPRETVGMPARIGVRRNGLHPVPKTPG